jgi:hypothetical protein
MALFCCFEVVMNDSVKLSIRRVEEAFERQDRDYAQLLNDAHKLAMYCRHQQSVIDAGDTAIKQLEQAVEHRNDCAKCGGSGQEYRHWNQDYIDCMACDGRGH